MISSVTDTNLESLPSDSVGPTQFIWHAKIFYLQIKKANLSFFTRCRDLCSDICYEIPQQTFSSRTANKLSKLVSPSTSCYPPPKLATPLQPAGRQKIRGVTSSCQGKPAGVCSSGLTDSTPRPHFFDLPGTASQLTGTTDGPGVGKQARQLSEAADSNGALQNS